MVLESGKIRKKETNRKTNVRAHNVSTKPSITAMKLSTLLTQILRLTKNTKPPKN